MLVSLKELGTITTGTTPSKQNSDYYNSDDICFIKPDLLSDSKITLISISNEYISENARTKAKIAGKDSIFVTCIGTIGKIGIASDGEYAFNQQINVIKANDTILPKYLAYALFYSKPRLEEIANAPVVPIINKTQFESFTIYIEFDKTKQNTIVSTLDKLQSIITHRKQQLEKLDLLVKARFVEMFGDPVSNPMVWETKPLLKIGTCKNGMNFRYDDSGVDIHCLGVGDFKDLSIITDTTTLPKISLNEMPSNEYILQNDDIVFVRSNGNKALVGRSLAVYPNEVPTTFSGFCIRFRKTDSSVTVPYLLRVLKTDSIRKKMAGRGANIQNLNQQILSTLEIPIPPLDLQNQFAAFVEQTDKSKFVVQRALDETQVLFDSLMQEYFG